MKLRTKIQLSFSITMAILLIIVGVVATQGSSNAIGILTNDSMANSAQLASDQISQRLQSYVNIVSLLGKDTNLSDTELSSDDKSDYLQKFVQTQPSKAYLVLSEIPPKYLMHLKKSR